jgi:3-oxoacyl-[acyl-carrier protein] reductase
MVSTSERSDPPSTKFAGKVALVTGGSRGIGAAIVRRFAQEGAAVAYTYTSAKAAADELAAGIKAAGGQALAIRADAADADAVISAVDQTAKTFGRLDILVNNAGVLYWAPLEKLTLEELDRTLAVNVRSVFIATQAAVRHMGQGGRIINIGSCNADRTPTAGGGIYAMSKSALIGLARGLARDLGPRGITINNVQPGPTDTDMNPAHGPDAPRLHGIMAVSRHAHGDEVAAMVSYVASPEAAMVTGTNLLIDGGYAA